MFYFYFVLSGRWRGFKLSKHKPVSKLTIPILIHIQIYSNAFVIPMCGSLCKRSFQETTNEPRARTSLNIDKLNEESIRAIDLRLNSI